LEESGVGTAGVEGDVACVEKEVGVKIVMYVRDNECHH